MDTKIAGTPTHKSQFYVMMNGGLAERIKLKFLSVDLFFDFTRYIVL